MEIPQPQPERPSVFISYSHDSEKDRERVLELAASLTRDGCDCRLDVYKDTDEDWPTWMLRQLVDADFVLCVCSKTYASRFDDDELPDVGLGVGWEAGLIRRMLYAKKLHNASIFPVLFDTTHRTHIPLELQGYDYYLLDSSDSLTYTSLLRKLLDSPEYERPKPGPAPKLETRKAVPAFGRPKQRTERGALRDLNKFGIPSDPIVAKSEFSYGHVPSNLDEESFRNWEGWDICGPVNEVALNDLQIHKSQGHPQYFNSSIPGFARLKKLLAERRNVLIRGAPSSGKTRMAFEAMQSQTDCWLLYVKPTTNESSALNQVFERVPRLPDSVPHAFLLYDDYEKYAGKQDYSRFIADLGRKRVSVVITLRNGPEYSQAKETFTQSLTILPIVEIQPLSETIAKEVSQGAGIDDSWQNGFDGTIGWILLGPTVKKAIFDSWSNNEPQRIILYVCKFLRTCGTHEYLETEVRELCESVFDLHIDDNTWRASITNLDGQNFLVNGKEDVFRRQRVEVYDALLDQVVQFDMDRNRLTSYLSHWAKRDRIDRLVALQSSYLSSESEEDLVRSALANCIENADRAVYHHLFASTLVGHDSRRDEEYIEREKATVLEPERAFWAYSLAVRLMEWNDARAKQWMEAAIRLQPNSQWEEHFGDYLIRQVGREAEAIAAYRRAVSLDNKNYSVKWRLAVTLAHEVGHSSEACDFAIQALGGHISLDVPFQLANMPAFRDAWLDTFVRKLMLGGVKLWIFDELQPALISAKIDENHLENVFTSVIVERKAAFNRPEDARRLSDSLRDLTTSFAGKRLYRGISLLAAKFLDELGSEYQYDETIASNTLAALRERVSVVQDAIELRELHIQALGVFRRFDTSQGVRETFVGFLGEAVLTSGRLNMSDAVMFYHEELKMVTHGHIDERELREISSDVIEVLLKTSAKTRRFDKVSECLENLENLCKAHSEQDYLRNKWASGIALTIETHAMDGHAEEVEPLLAALQKLSLNHQDDAETRASFAWALENAIAVNADRQDLEKAREYQTTLGNLATRYPSEPGLQLSQIRTMSDCLIYPLRRQREVIECSIQHLKELLEAKQELDASLRVAYWCEGLSHAAWVYAKCKELCKVELCLDELSSARQEFANAPDLRYHFAFGLHAAAMAAGDKAPEQLQQYLAFLSDLATRYPDEPELLKTLAHCIRNLAVTAINEHRISDWKRYEGRLESLSQECPNEASVQQLHANALLALVECSSAVRGLDVAKAALQKLSELALRRANDPLVRSAQCSALARIVFDLGETDCFDEQENVISQLRQVADEYSDESGPRVSLATASGNALLIATMKKNAIDVRCHLSVLESTSMRWPDETSIRVVLAEGIVDAAMFFLRIGIFEEVSDACLRLIALTEEHPHETGIAKPLARALAQFSWDIGAKKHSELMDLVRRCVSHLLVKGRHDATDIELLCRIAEANLTSWAWFAEDRTIDAEYLRAISMHLYNVSRKSSDPYNMHWGVSTAAELRLLCRDFQTAYLWSSEALKIAPDDPMDGLYLATALCGLDHYDRAEPIIQKALSTLEDASSLRWFVAAWADLWPSPKYQQPEIVRLKTVIRDRLNKVTGDRS